MSFRLTVTSIVCGVLVASCGGGGGSPGVSGSDGTQVGVPLQLVALTTSTVKPVAANALENVMNASATRITGLPIGAAGVLQVIAAAPSGIVNGSKACPDGGNITVTGNVANTSALSPGDTLTITNNNCRINQAGVELTFNGQVSIKVVSGSVTNSLPFHAVMDTTATNLSVQSGSSLVVSNGDARIDWNVSSATSQTVSATGNSVNTRETISGVTRNTTLSNYTQGLTTVGTLLTSTLSGTVQTDSPSLGPGGGAYIVSTPAAVVWDAVSGIVIAGTVNVVGASNAQMSLIFTGNNNAQILLDSNGSGTFDQTIGTNVTELAGML